MFGIEVEAFKWIIVGGLSLIVWFLRKTLTDTEKKIDEVTKELLLIKAEQSGIKENYLHKADFREFKAELRQMIEGLREDLKALRKP